MQETRETWVWSLGWEDPLGEEMATHSSILAWKIPWTEEPGGPQSVGSQRGGQTERLTLCMFHWIWCKAIFVFLSSGILLLLFCLFSLKYSWFTMLWRILLLNVVKKKWLSNTTLYTPTDIFSTFTRDAAGQEDMPNEWSVEQKPMNFFQRQQTLSYLFPLVSSWGLCSLFGKVLDVTSLWFPRAVWKAPSSMLVETSHSEFWPYFNLLWGCQLGVPGDLKHRRQKHSHGLI